MAKGELVNVVVDVESDGPCPVIYSMVSFAAIVAEPALNRTFAARCAPVSGSYDRAAMEFLKLTREEHETYPPANTACHDLNAWLGSLGGRPVFWSDNPAFDWQWINWYMIHNVGRNPFGHSARRIGDLYAGVVGRMDAHTEWKRMRKTAHTHDPLDDARGNAEALLQILDMLKGRRQ